MDRILGIDLGTNSIGWAIVDKDNGTTKLIDKGVNIFQEGVAREKNNVENLKVAFIEGSAHESYINQTFPIADVCTYNTGEELYNALKQGKIDAYIDDELSIQSQCSKKDDLVLDRVLPGSDYGFIFNKSKLVKMFKICNKSCFSD